MKTTIQIIKGIVTKSAPRASWQSRTSRSPIKLVNPAKESFGTELDKWPARIKKAFSPPSDQLAMDIARNVAQMRAL